MSDVGRLIANYEIVIEDMEHSSNKSDAKAVERLELRLAELESIENGSYFDGRK